MFVAFFGYMHLICTNNQTDGTAFCKQNEHMSWRLNKSTVGPTLTDRDIITSKNWITLN